MSIHSFQKFKDAHILLPDVEMMLKILTATEKALTYYSHYIPAAKVMFAAKDQKKLLEGYRTELMNIKTNKGAT